MGKPDTDDKMTPSPAEQLRQSCQSDQPLMDERRTIIAEYVSYLREILKTLRKRLN